MKINVVNQWEVETFCVTQNFSGCNLNHGYCREPGQCICHVGWSGPTCEDCTKQPNCPISANCSEPAGCFCDDVQNGTPCMIENAPPRLTTKYNVPKHYMTRECTRFNSQQPTIVERPKPRSLIDGNSFEIKFYNLVKNTFK